jgi:uncharacterized repeat protein (TIGR03803 family)
VIFDQTGNLYGTTEGGPNCDGDSGTVYELTPSAQGWTERQLYDFTCESDGFDPKAGLFIDQSGNLYGATSSGGSGNGGTVFELTPSSGSWAFSVLYSLGGSVGGSPARSLTMDTAGNLYGTNNGGAYGRGNVFKMTPSNGGWTYASMYDFTGGNDGEYPISNVTFDANGNLFGTASGGGAYGAGVVWEITP